MIAAPAPITLGSQTGTVVYLDDDWNVVPKEQATLARVLFDDGTSTFYHVSNIRTAGDVEGHEFHGNQWTGYKDTAQGIDTKTQSAKDVLDARTGQPLDTTLYRGVNPTETGKFNRIPSQFAVGEYRTPFPEVAATYGSKVNAVPTKLENPYVFTLGEKAYFTELKKEFGTRDPSEITRQLLSKGHDGLIVKNVSVNRGEISMRDSAEVIVFDRRNAGDVEGHPFHGNQWTSSAAQLARDKAANDPRHFLDTPKGALSGLLHHEMVNIDRHDVRDLLELAAKQKEDPDLTNLHVEGTQLFGGSASRLSRKEMPQIPGEHREDFVAHERERGIQIDREDVSPLTLSPMQSEVSARAVGEQLAKYGKGDKTIAPILISKDNRVLDGHHHWAMMATLALENPSIKVPVYRIQESAHPAIFRMRDYANLKGHASVAIGEKTPRTLEDTTDNRPVHKVADKHYPKIKVVAKYAFAKGRQALGWPPDADAAAEAVRKALTKLLPPALLQVVEDSGNVALQNLPEVRTAGDVEGHPFHGNQWTNAAHTMASQLSGQTPAAPIKTITAYHVTKRKNVESILKTGFDLNKVKPRWQNDMAVSLNKGQQKAADYFTHSDPKTGKPLASGLDTTKYGLLEVKMKGRTFDPYDEPHESHMEGARGYTRSTIGKGFDAAEMQGGMVYVYNPKSILSIREVPVPVRAPKEPRARKLKTAGDIEGHEFHGNQWTAGNASAQLTEAAGGKKFIPLLEKNPVFPAFLNPTDREQYRKDFSHVPEARRSGASVEQDMPLTNLVASQKDLEVKAVADIIKKGGFRDYENELPLLVKWHDKIVIGDGHHRIASHLLRGITHDTVEYLDLDAYLKKPRALGDIEGHEFHGNQWTSGSTVYHGTDTPFHAFDPAKIGSKTDPGLLGKGIYFSTDPNVARSSTYRIHAKVALENPVHVQATKWEENKTAIITTALGLPKTATAAEITREAQKQGHDGVVLDYSPLGYHHQEVVAFDPKQTAITHVDTTEVRALGDVEGHEFHGNQWTTGSSNAIAETYGTTHLPEAANFLLRDGRMVRSNSMHHSLQAERVGVSLGDLEQEGVIRLIPGGAEVAHEPTSEQAKLLADHWTSDKEHSDHVLDVTTGRQTLGSIVFKGRITADAIRSFTRRALKNSKDDPPLYEVRHLGDVPGHEFHGNQYTAGYHVTFTKSVPEINKKGIQQFHDSNWVKGSPTGERYGQGEVYAFEHPGDALQWAGKMDFHLNREFGSGKVSVVKFDAKGWKGWNQDTSDPISQAGAAGKWYKKEGGVLPGDIKGAVAITTEHTAQIRSRVERKDMTLKGLKGKGQGPKMSIEFNMPNDAAAAWAREHGGELIDGITDETLDRINEAVASAHEDGDLEDMRAEIEDAVGDDARAEMIGRTESMAAANEGQREGWEQAAEEGLLPPGYKRVWIATSDACPECDDLNGETTDEDGTYPDDGEDGPPLHPNCRCTEGIAE